MYPDFKELLPTLNAHKVEYLIVGGFAVGFHSQPRATKDLDSPQDLADIDAIRKAEAAQRRGEGKA